MSKQFRLIGLIFIMGNMFSTSAWAQLPKRYIVKYKSSKTIKVVDQNSLNAISQNSFNSFSALTLSQTSDVNDDIEYIEQDLVLQKFQTVPNDPEYSSQWSLRDPLQGMQLPTAWDKTTGDNTVAIAVVDSGVNAHHDLASKLEPGVDLIDDPQVSNDGDGRDHDASDPGDWIDSNSVCYSQYNRFIPSSWHGTHIAGSIAALSDNFTGMTGVNWNARIVPVRVLGVCGGYTSDIAQGIRWAAGDIVPGLNVNTTKVNVINLSLGGPGPCSQTMQAAIDFARSKKISVVVATGNSNLSINTNQITPANCKGVIRVASHNQVGDKSSFSNFGKGTHISAPGTNILSLSDTGATIPNNDTYASYNGTSMSAANVSGVVSLIYSLNEDIFPDQVIDSLVRTARDYGHSSNCDSADNSICGHGKIDAKALLDRVENVIPDASFVYDDDFVEEEPERGTLPIQFAPSGGDGGGSCGSIALIDRKSTQSKNSMFSFFFSLLVSLSMALLVFRSKNNSKLLARLIAGP